MAEVNRRILNIPTSLKHLFIHYLEVTKFMNKLRPKEIQLLGLILYYRQVEAENFKREEDLWKHLFSYDFRIKIKDELELEDYNFQNYLVSLRKKKALIKEEGVEKVNPHFIPQIEYDTKDYQIIFNFHING